MSDRFFVDGPIHLGEFDLQGDEAHHLAHVRRLEAGDRVVLFNGDGQRYPAIIETVSRRQVTVLVTGVEASLSETTSRVWVASALPKADRFDFLLEKLTELGVSDFIPLITERSVVIPRIDRMDKWRRAVIEVSKQCGRDRLMAVHPPQSLEACLLRPDLPPVRKIAHPGGASLAETAMAEGIVVMIGPEGGFSEQEVNWAEQAGWEKVSLGPRILRIETAALAVATWSTLIAPGRTNSAG